MKNLLLLGRCFYGIGIVGIGIQQFIYSEFRPVILAYWSPSFPDVSIWAHITGGLLVLAGTLIIFGIKVRIASLALAVFLLLLFIFSHVYYQLFLNPNDFHLGSWTDALKELALSGGAFIMAVSFSAKGSFSGNKIFLESGRIFFSIMLIAFGIDHLLYTEFVATLVPNWIPGHIFWTYFAAVALIGSGVCFILKIKTGLVGILAGSMLFIWFVILHIPRAITDPDSGKGNEITSVFEALAFSGIAFIIACLYPDRISRKKIVI